MRGVPRLACACVTAERIALGSYTHADQAQLTRWPIDIMGLASLERGYCREIKRRERVAGLYIYVRAKCVTFCLRREVPRK